MWFSNRNGYVGVVKEEGVKAHHCAVVLRTRVMLLIDYRFEHLPPVLTVRDF